MLTRISGIPCEVELLSIRGRYAPAKTDAPPEQCYPAEFPEVEFAILDRRGYPADWLEAKMTQAERQRIISALLKEDESSRDEGITF